MKLRNLIFTALTALALSVLAGCSSETELPQDAPDPTIPEGMTRIDFTIKGVKTGTSYATPTVGLEEYERAMKDITAYFFKMADGQTVPADADKVAYIVTASSIANGKSSLMMPANTKAGTYSVVFVANKACYNTALGNVTKDATTYAQLNAIETLSNTEIMEGISETPADNKGLPMRALTNSVLIPASGGKVEIRADFSRPLSRFDIDNQALHSFKVTSMSIVYGRMTSPLNAPGNTAGTPNKVAESMVLDPTEYTKLLSDVNAKIDPPVDGAISQLRPAFYAAPGLVDDGTSLQVKGKLIINLDEEEDRTYTIPLKSKTDGSTITIGANKRYGVTLKMTPGNDIVADISVNLGDWGDDDETITDVPKDVYYIVAPTTLSTGTSYTESTKTFVINIGIPTFRFEMLSTLPDAVITTDGTVVKSVAPVADTPDTRTTEPNHAVYEVTVAGAIGATGTFTFTTKDGTKNFVFNVKLVEDTTYPVPGVTEKAILLGDIYWAPVNVGALSSTSPGRIFQFGRMSSWLSGPEVEKNMVRIPILPSEAEAPQYKGKYIIWDVHYGYDWWSYSTTEEKAILKEIFDRWNGVSQDESTHPCPVGWRLPTVKEARALVDGDEQRAEVVSVYPRLWKITIKGVTFTTYQFYSYTGVYNDQGSRYWLSGEEGMTLDDDTMRTIISVPAGIGISFLARAATDAYNVRCVKDRVLVTP